MGVIVAYTVLAGLFLALSIGLLKPKAWRDLSPKQARFLRFGCLLGCVIIIFQLVRRLL